VLEGFVPWSIWLFATISQYLSRSSAFPILLVIITSKTHKNLVKIQPKDSCFVVSLVLVIVEAMQAKYAWVVI